MVGTRNEEQERISQIKRAWQHWALLGDLGAQPAIPTQVWQAFSPTCAATRIHWKLDVEQARVFLSTFFNSLKVRLSQGRGYPSRYAKQNDEKTLANWVNTQRQAYRGKNRLLLTKGKISKLLTLPDWKFSKSSHESAAKGTKRKSAILQNSKQKSERKEEEAMRAWFGFTTCSSQLRTESQKRMQLELI